MSARPFGARVTRFEDPALYPGAGAMSTTSRHPAGCTLVSCEARSRTPDSAQSKATVRALPGVHAVLTAGDLPEPMRGRIPTLQANPAMNLIRTEHCLAGDEICYAGARDRRDDAV